MSRWERGILIQNGAYDNYLYWIGFSENLRRLRERKGNKLTNITDDQQSKEPTFREIEVTEELRQKQNSFELQLSLNAGK